MCEYMTRADRNPKIWLEGESVVLMYDHIISYMNSKQKFINVNSQLVDKLAA